MRAKIWGCRGSLATPGPETVRYGGNTSSVEVRLSDDSLIVLDAGTGIRSLGEAIGRNRPRKIYLLLSHLHLDHLEGLPFFGPLWSDETEVEIWGPSSPISSLEDNIARYMSPPLFPIRLIDVPARCSFHSVSYDEWSIGTAKVRSQPVEHPGPTVGFRIEENGKALVYIPDHEPAAGGDLGTVPADWLSGHALAAGADVLLHDAQYTRQEYERKAGWGHSSVDATVAFASIARVDRLVLFHHDPSHSDEDIDAMAHVAGELAGSHMPPPEAGYEQMKITLE